VLSEHRDRASLPGLELTDDLVARFTAGLEGVPFTELVGLKVVTLQNDAVHMRLGFRPEIGRGHGILHGGAIFTLLDVTAGAMCAIAHGSLTDGVTYVTVQASAQFLGVARHEDLDCVARPVKIGKSTIFIDAEIHAGERAVARGSFVFQTARPASATPTP
jgi:acyl-CoA thioesterase